MKEHLSVATLLIRLKMKWVLITLACIPLITLPVYWLFFTGESVPSFSVGAGHILFLVIFAAGSAMVAMECSGMLFAKDQQRYMFSRLQISERMVLVWNIAVCTLFMLMLWQVEIITLGAAGLIHNSTRWNQGGPQDVVASLYYITPYRNVIPTFNAGGWLMGILRTIAAGVACGCISMFGGKSASRGVGIITLILMAVAFLIGMRTEVVFFLVLAMVTTIVLTVKHLQNGKERTEDETTDC